MSNNEELLELNNFPELDKLSDSEKQTVLEILSEMSKKGSSKKFDDLRYADYNEIPVDIETFINDDYYLGNAWKDSEGKSKLYPYWKKFLKKLFPDNLTTSVNNVILSGARGLGKSEIFVLIAAYLMHRVLCLKNPLEHFHLKPTEKLCFAFMNIKLDLAEEIGNSKFQNTVKLSPWFLKHGTMEGRGTTKTWAPPDFIQIIIGSQASDVIGLPIYFAFFDEISFIRNQDIDKQKARAIDMIDTAIGGQKTRFLFNGKLEGLLGLASSKRSEKSFLETHMKKKLETEKENIMIVDEPVWNIKPANTYSGVRFNVALGNKFLPSKVIPDGEDLKEWKLKGYNILEVPVEFKSNFKEDIERALCDYAGIASSELSKYISGEAVRAIINPKLINPFTKDIIEVGNAPDDKLQYYDFFDLNKVSRDMMRKPLFIHLDMSVSGDMTGIAGVWIKGKKHSSIEENQSKELYYQLAFSVSIKAPKGRQISFEKNRQLIYWLKEQGFNIKGITSDTFQSYDTGQAFLAKKLPYSVLSVDRVDSDHICLTGDTLIKTPGGVKQIKDLIPGDIVYGYDISTNKLIKTPINSWQETDIVNEYYEITTEDGSVIKCTGNHLILTKNRGYVRADSLTEEDEITQYKDGRSTSSKVKSIKKVKCDNLPVYDISVPKYENFTLGNGLIVHNCKPYQHLKSIIYEERLEIYESETLIEEWVNLERNINNGRIDHPECFTGDTKVRLVDGRSICFKDLVEEYNEGKINYVYSINLDKKIIEPKEIIDARVTRHTDKLCYVYLDNDEVIKCTPDHLFMLRDGTYCQAQDLKENQALMPLYIKYPKEGFMDPYRLYYDPFKEVWHYEHRQFAQEIADEKYLVHHKDCNPSNNNPNNLIWCSKSYHQTLHKNLSKGCNCKEARYKKSLKMKKYHENRDLKYLERNKKIQSTQLQHSKENNTKTYILGKDILEINKLFKIDFKSLSRGDKTRYRKYYEYYLKSGIILSKEEKENNLQNKIKWVKDTYGLNWENLSKGEKITYGREYNLGCKQSEFNFNRYIKDISYQDLYQYYIEENHNGPETCEYFGIGHDILTKLFRYYNIKKDDSLIRINISKKLRKEYKNHKVKYIKIIEADEDVYDITVKDNHNFALDSGVFVHNCFRKDVSDAVCGAAFNASKNAEQFAFDYGEDIQNTLEVSSGSSDYNKQQLTVAFEEELKNFGLSQFRKPQEQPQQQNQPQQQSNKSPFKDFGLGSAQPLPASYLSNGIIVW